MPSEQGVPIPSDQVDGGSGAIESASGPGLGRRGSRTPPGLPWSGTGSMRQLARYRLSTVGILDVDAFPYGESPLDSIEEDA